MHVTNQVGGRMKWQPRPKEVVLLIDRNTPAVKHALAEFLKEMDINLNL